MSHHPLASIESRLDLDGATARDQARVDAPQGVHQAHDHPLVGAPAVGGADEAEQAAGAQYAVCLGEGLGDVGVGEEVEDVGGDEAIEGPIGGFDGHGAVGETGLRSVAEGGEAAVLLDEGGYRYLRINFAGDVVVGALSIGHTENIGILRGLIQTRAHLGPWKEKLQANPTRLAEAYIACCQ